MSVLLAVDPSIRSSGVALFHHGQLRDAAQVTLRAASAPASVRAADMVRAIVKWLTNNQPFRLDVIVLEEPQVYVAGRSKGSAQDLLGLAGVCAGLLVALPEAAPIVVKPAAWAGQVPKSKARPWESPRGARIWSRLRALEREVAPDQHDAVDAIGLGLHALGRLARVRVLPGADAADRDDERVDQNGPRPEE